MIKLGTCAEANVSLVTSSPHLQKTHATYRTRNKRLSRQVCISVLIDIQLIGVGITASLVRRRDTGLELAIIPRARVRTGIDNLHDNALSDAANSTS